MDNHPNFTPQPPHQSSHTALLAILITVLIVGAGAFAWQQYTFYTFNREVNARINALTQVIEDQKKSEVIPTPNSTVSTPNQDSPANTEATELVWKQYENPSLKVKFLYPPDFVITEDKEMARYTNGTFYHRITLQNNQVPEKPYMIFEYNPAGFGTYPDTTYTLSENQDGTLTIASTNKAAQQDADSDFDDPTTHEIVVTPLQAQNGAEYFWLFRYNTVGTNYESVFQKILNSFVLSK